jgi:hypothetical protein
MKQSDSADKPWMSLGYEHMHALDQRMLRRRVTAGPAERG